MHFPEFSVTETLPALWSCYCKTSIAAYAHRGWVTEFRLINDLTDHVTVTKASCPTHSSLPPSLLKCTCLLSYHVPSLPLPPLHPCHCLPGPCLLFSETLSHSGQTAQLTWAWNTHTVHNPFTCTVQFVTSATAHLKSKENKKEIQKENCLRTTEESRGISHPVK